MSAALLLIAALLAGDWPRFRGPNGSGVADASEAPAQFGNVVWKLPLPPGHSSPILSGTRVFLTAFDGGKLYTYAIERASGKIVWRRECPRSRTEPLDKRNSAASPSPAIDGTNVYVFFGDYGLISYSYEGEERWRTPLGRSRTCTAWEHRRSWLKTNWSWSAIKGSDLLSSRWTKTTGACAGRRRGRKR